MNVLITYFSFLMKVATQLLLYIYYFITRTPKLTQSFSDTRILFPIKKCKRSLKCKHKNSEIARDIIIWFYYLKTNCKSI